MLKSETGADLFRIVIETIADGILVQDRSFKCMYANEAGARMCGYPSAAEFIHGSIPDTLARFELHDEDGQPFPLDLLPARRVFNGEPTPAPSVIRVRNLVSGSETWSHVTARPILDQQGQALYAVSIFRDVTRQRLAEERASSQAEGLRQALQARDEFLSIASHELKTPLTSLALHCQAFERRLAHPAARSFFETTSNQIDRLTRLIDAMLDVSRITHGKLRIEPETVELSELLRDVLARHAAQLEQAEVVPRVTLEGPVTGSWDRYRIEQVVTNLVTNAIKHAPGNPLSLSLRSAGDKAVLVVRDHGPGIPHEALGRIFQRFERGAGNSPMSGLGLGLYISHQILDAHGGSIRAENSRDGGAVFTIELPLSGRS